MKLDNQTPFATQVFPDRLKDGSPLGVLIVRGSFELGADTGLALAKKHDPVVMADTFHGEPGHSSLARCSDLVGAKPGCDVLITGTAQAPGGQPADCWELRIQVGDKLDHHLRVTGPRHWRKEGDAWQLSDPARVTSVPLRYEHAYGGRFEDEEGNTHRCAHNPVGVGFLPDGEAPPTEPWPAPQLEAIDDPIGTPARTYRVAGTAPIGRGWQPRASYVGTLDEVWREHRAPAYPDDFDYRHHQCAHPDLICDDHLHGDERVRLEGFAADGPLAFALPNMHVIALIRFKAGPLIPVRATLDTLTIDVDERKVWLTWRAGMGMPDFALVKGVDVLVTEGVVRQWPPKVG